MINNGASKVSPGIDAINLELQGFTSLRESLSLRGPLPSEPTAARVASAREALCGALPAAIRALDGVEV